MKMKRKGENEMKVCDDEETKGNELITEEEEK